MKVTTSVSLGKSETLLIGLFKTDKKKIDSIDVTKQFGTKLPNEVVHSIIERISEKEFEGDLDTSITLYSIGNFKKIIISGLGDEKKEIETDTIRKLGATMIHEVRKYRSTILLLPKKLCVDKNFKVFFEGFFLGDYKFEQYLSKKSDATKLNEIICIGLAQTGVKALLEVEKIAENIRYLRDMINTPANDMSPEVLEKYARTLSKYKNIKLKVLDFETLEKMKAGGIVAVGKGASEKSRMIVIEYKNAPTNKKPYALVGKGVTFDTGGINLKPSKHIEDMKLDMSGAATVMTLFKLMGELQPKLHAVGIMGIVENALSRDAYKPGDIITALNGKTIEILNTDAEGRLVLADCLTYVEKEYKPEYIIDLATLTGHAVYAVGHDITPVMTNNKDLVNRLIEKGNETDEIMWELPMHAHYRKAVKGTIADLDNSADSVKAGTITAAMFLEHFINNGTPWIHCDIASTAFGDKADGPYKPVGARGVLVRTLWEFINKK